MKFKEVVGQSEIKQRLVQLVNGDRLPHALMLCGGGGCGKLSLALAFASYLLCEGDKADGEACGVCPQCAMLRKWAHPDLHFSFPVIRPTGTSSEHKMSSDDFIMQWREMLSKSTYVTMDQWLTAMDAVNQQAQMGVGESDALIRKLSLKSSQGRYKISVIWLPERMNIECANKLLKLLEEPPVQTIFIMVCEQPEYLLDTIRSRAQRIDIKRINTADIEHALIERRGIEPEVAQRLARLAHGSWSKAVGVLDANSENGQFLEMFMMLMRLAYMRNIKDLKKWSEAVASYGREKQRRMLTYFARMVRENFMYNFRVAELTYMTQEEEQFAQKFSPFINERNVVEFSELINVSIRDIGQNANAKMVFFDFALKAIMLLKT